MTSSSQHQLAKYLSSLLQPVLSLYSSNCVLDSFTFADIIKSSKLDSSSVFLCSFDIFSLFTNVPLAEPIQITADTLYKIDHLSLPFPRKVFIELMKIAISSVEFISTTSFTARSMELLWFHLSDLRLPTFLLATMKPNYFRLSLNQQCITSIWMTLL